MLLIIAISADIDLVVGVLDVRFEHNAASMANP